jgi:hypothetical protein
MTFRSFSSAFAVVLFLSLSAKYSFATGIQTESVLDKEKVEGVREKLHSTTGIPKDVSGTIDNKKDSDKTHENEQGAVHVEDNSSSSESVVDISSVSRPMFQRKENAGKPAQFSFGTQEFSLANSAGDMKAYGDSDDLFSYKSILDEVRDGLGEGVYSKLAWTYSGIKDLDDKIYASMVGYDLSGSDFLGKLHQFIGVDQQLSAMIFFSDSLGRMQEPFGAISGENKGANKGGNSKVVLDFSLENFARNEGVDTGRIQLILSHLTIKNFVYSLLSLMGAGMVWRMFRFFLKQDLS